MHVLLETRIDYQEDYDTPLMPAEAT